MARRPPPSRGRRSGRRWSNGRSSPTPQRDAGEGGDEGAKGVAAYLEVAVLVVGGAGGGKQHDGLGCAARGGIARRGGERRIERPATRKADLALERGGK